MKPASRNAIVALLICAALTPVAAAQTYPTKPIRIIVPFPPGGISDALARVTAQHFSSTWGQQAVVDNRPGAGTTLAADMVAKAAPDGYTLYFTDTTTHAINATLYSRLPYDSVKDFTAIAMVAQTPLILVVHPSLPVKTVKDLVALAKSRPDQINYSSSGNGTILHLAGETLKTMAHVRMVHIPYKGSAPAVAAVMGGEASLTFGTTPAALPNVKAGKLRAIGVSSAKRSEVVPDVPPIAETLPGFDIILYSGIMGPANIPRDVVKKIHDESTHMLSLPKVKETWASFGAAPVSMTPEQFTEHLRADIVKLGKMVEAAGAKVD
jgi:tripartite-type tricarboxylate transporter receptor subunit TctC